MLPVFAFAMKLLYLFSHRYYMEHVIITLFSQSYIFFMLLFLLTLEKGHEALVDIIPSLVLFHTFVGLVISIAYFLIPIHIYQLQKRVYGQSHAVTLIKFILLALTYFSLLGIMIAMAAVWSVITL